MGGGSGIKVLSGAGRDYAFNSERIVRDSPDSPRLHLS
jgi:hypothetical protein